MATATAKYDGEEIEVHFQGTVVPTDLGVPRSPTIHEVVDIQITALEILGQNWKPGDLPANLVSQIYELAEEVEFETA